MSTNSEVRRRTYLTLIFVLIFFVGPLYGIEEVEVVGVSPGPGLGKEIDKVPFSVQGAGYDDLKASQSLDLSDFMNQTLHSVNINSAQNNPLQADVQYRGFTSSPLLGLPQGISVYQNGVRINEPLGDSINWDLVPESAVNRINLIGGADPLFGLNTLGGALLIDMKNGFNFSGHQAEVYSGSWERVVASLESGGNNGTWGYYANISFFDEEGWRQLSDSDTLNFYGSLSWRDGEQSTVNLSYQRGESDLTGNGASPVGLLAIDRDAIFTAPDVTENDMHMVSIDGTHFITPNIQLAGNMYWRANDTDSFNGDASEFERCEFAGGAVSLFEEAEAIEDALEDELGIELDDICDGNNPAINNFSDLETFIETQAMLAALDPEDFELEDVSDELSGTGIISDEAINNISRREQESKGIDGKLLFLNDLFGHDNRLTVGFSYYEGEAEFNSVTELSELNPITRSTQGLGTGLFVDEAATSINTESEVLSVYFTDTFEINQHLVLTLGGRYNSSDISLRDLSGERPELNGDHRFSRFNPSIGFTYKLKELGTIFGSYSESNRVPTPIELACNEGVFELAQTFAIAAGEDPDDIEFECRLPNAFLADPPLDDVVTKSFELGVRGKFKETNYHLGFFHATNRDDIIFQTTGRATGLFANINKTRRLGLELALNGSFEKLDWNLSYSYIEATFEDDFEVLSPNHPSANDEGNINVQTGDRIPGIPESIFKFSATYNVNDKFNSGFDAVYNSSQVIRGDESNELDSIDGFIVVNFRASYRYNDWLTLFARVTNIFDTGYENFGLLGEDPSEVVNNLADNRPVFLGAGAPRAGWAGIRFNF